MKAITPLFTILALLLYSSLSLAQIQIGQSLFGPSAETEFGHDVAISGDGNQIAVSGIYYGNQENGRISIYNKNGNTWSLSTNLNGTQGFAWYGYRISLAAEGNVIACGSPVYDQVGSNSGLVEVYAYTDGLWSLKGEKLFGDVNDLRFGRSVSLSADGNRLAVSAYKTTDAKTGFVKVYDFIQGAWTPIGETLMSDDSIALLGYNLVLSDDGNRLAVIERTHLGSNEIEPYSVKIFQWNDSSWELIGDIPGGNINGAILPPLSFNYDGSRLALGIPKYNSTGSGQINVFDYIENDWVLSGSSIFGEANGDQFGYDLALSQDGNTLIAGIRFNNQNGNHSGQVRIFKYINDNWQQEGIELNGDALYTHFGTAVDISDDGDKVIIGAPSHDSPSNDIGLAKTYSLCASMSIDSIRACEPYTWINGQTYTSNNNTATYLLTNSIGCDSVIRLHIEVEPIQTGVIQDSISLISLDPDAFYTWVDCQNDFIPIPNETSRGFNPTNNGSYAVILTQGFCTDTSDCVEVDFFTSLSDQSITNLLHCYPNPTTGLINIDLPFLSSEITATIFNTKGQIQKVDRFTNQQQIKTTLPIIPGVYFIEIKTSNAVPVFLKVLKL